MDVGYVPVTDAVQKSPLSHVYSLTPWKTWSINYVAENFTNPTSGPIFKQLYFRQAMQDLVDQPGLIKAAFGGYASPTYGPVPTAPSSEFLDAFERSNPYPYNPAAALLLLQGQWLEHQPGRREHLRAGRGPAPANAARASNRVRPRPSSSST